jgi:hypothetical protein
MVPQQDARQGFHRIIGGRMTHPTPNEDRELLEAAARAADLPLAIHWNGYSVAGVEPLRLWNPLTDSGDAFDLAVKCRIDIPWQTFAAGTPEHDELAMIRRAIVRAAATLGKE